LKAELVTQPTIPLAMRSLMQRLEES